VTILDGPPEQLDDRDPLLIDRSRRPFLEPALEVLIRVTVGDPIGGRHGLAADDLHQVARRFPSV